MESKASFRCNVIWKGLFVCDNIIIEGIICLQETIL